MQLAPWFGCPGCGAPSEIPEDAFDDYFSGKSASCQHCQRAFDLWEGVSSWISAEFSFGSALTLAGAQATGVRVPFGPNQTVGVNLTTAGVPANAEIVSLNLTSGCPAFPALLTGNDVLKEPFPPGFVVFGVPVPELPGDQSNGSSGTLGVLFVHAVWFVRKPDDTDVRHLVDAARHFEAKRFESVVVPANIAAEAALTPVVALALASFGNAEARERFLRDGATYSHQLNILLALLADFHRIDRMPEVVRTKLNRLRKLRNDVGHSGKCAPQTKNDAAHHLAAAIFGVRYATFLRRRLQNVERSLPTGS